MLWSIDACQIRLFADQYHVTITRAQVLDYYNSQWKKKKSVLTYPTDCDLC